MKFDFESFDFAWRERYNAEDLAQMETQLRHQLTLANAEIEYSIRWRLARLHHFRAMQNEENNERKSAYQQFKIARNEAQRALNLHAEFNLNAANSSNLFRDSGAISESKKNHNSDEIRVSNLESNEGANREVKPKKNHDFEENRGAAHFWFGVNLIESARTQSKLAPLFCLARARRHLRLAAQIDATFHHAGAFRVLARMAHKTPRFLGGNQMHAAELFRQALEIAPTNSTTQLYFAELLLSQEKPKKAREILEEIVSRPRDESWIWEQARDREIAKKLLQKLNEPAM